MKRKHVFLAVMFAMMFLSLNTVSAQQTVEFMQAPMPELNNSQYSYYAPPVVETKEATAAPLQGKVVVIPANVAITGVTTTAYNSETLNTGDCISLMLPNGFFYNGVEVAPQGTLMSGIVTKSKKSGHATKNGQLQIKFTSLTTPFGQVIPISGKVKTDDCSGIIYGGTKWDTTKEYAKDVTIGAASGAVLGTAMGALSKGKVGRGAVFGTAVGAGLGLGKSLWDKGEDVCIPANAYVDVVLDQPVTYTPVQYR